MTHRPGDKVSLGLSSLVSISIKGSKKYIIDYMNKYTLNRHDINIASITINLPNDLWNYFSFLPKGIKSKAVINMIEDFIHELEDKNIGAIFISATALIRHAILFDMILSLKERVVTKYALDVFSKGIRSGKRRRTHKRGSRFLRLGNIYHPNGSWRHYHSKEDLQRNEQFQLMYNKIKPYFSARYVMRNYSKFKDANNLKLLDNLENSNDLKKVYDLVHLDNI